VITNYTRTPDSVVFSFKNDMLVISFILN